MSRVYRLGYRIGVVMGTLANYATAAVSPRVSGPIHHGQGS
jgi:hypothetical protein